MCRVINATNQDAVDRMEKIKTGLKYPAEWINRAANQGAGSPLFSDQANRHGVPVKYFGVKARVIPDHIDKVSH